MIGRIAGLLLARNPPEILVDVGGVGYELDVPMSTFYDLPAVGERVVLLTHQVVREDAHLLYGFLTASERSAFRELIRISGIGPRMALAVLSGLSVADLTSAVALQESGRLVKVPGIGKKTADRLLLELKGKLGPELAGASAQASVTDHSADILRALVSLGYSEKEAGLAARQVPTDASVSDGIKQALKLLARA